MADRRVLEGRFRNGSLLGGRYELGSLIGQGGMAEVYVATDRQLRRPVAVKVLWEGLARDPRFLTRFRREARAAASLSHPGIVAVHDIGSEAGLPFIVMELVPGRTLSECIWSEGPMPPGRAASIAEAVAEALEHAHGRGIVHRDVKPGNIVLTPAGDVKVLDFGISQVLAWTPVGATPNTHGTPEYISPEQASGGPTDRRSDVYSLGVVLYEMLTGRPPFSGGSPVEVAYRHVQDRPAPPSLLNPRVPDSLDAVVMRCLAKAPAGRYARARDLSEDLRRFRSGSPSLTVPMRADGTGELPGPWQHRPAPTPLRRRWPAAVAGAIVTALLGTAVLAFAAGVRERPNPAPSESASPSASASPSPSPSPTPILAPNALTAVASCDGMFSTRISLRWGATRSNAADGYEVYRATSRTGPWQYIGLVTGRIMTTYTDRGLDLDTSYHYLVKATGEGRTSVGAARAQAKTPLFCLF